MNSPPFFVHSRDRFHASRPVRISVHKPANRADVHSFAHFARSRLRSDGGHRDQNSVNSGASPVVDVFLLLFSGCSNWLFPGTSCSGFRARGSGFAHGVPGFVSSPFRVWASGFRVSSAETLHSCAWFRRAGSGFASTAREGIWYLAVQPRPPLDASCTSTIPLPWSRRSTPRSPRSERWACLAHSPIDGQRMPVSKLTQRTAALRTAASVGVRRLRS